jgi:alpha-tubulin suppressor-like RCC1 family protein
LYSLLDRGQLGVGTRINEVEFVPVLGALKGVALSAIACGNSHNLVVVAETGEMYAWGSNGKFLK